MEYVLMCPSDLMTIIEMEIRKSPLPRRVTATWFTDKIFEWSLDLNKAARSYCNLLLVGIDHESYPA